MPKPRPLPDQVAYILDLLRLVPGVQAKAMFGGHGLYRDGLMFAIVIDEQLYFKVDDETVAAYAARGLGPFTYTSRGKTASLRYHVAPPEVLDDPQAMAQWALAACEVAVRAQAARARKASASSRLSAGVAPAVARRQSGKAGTHTADKTEANKPTGDLAALRNLGPASQAMLAQAGIRTVARLRELGSVQAYAMTRKVNAQASLNLLWALEGALSDRPWQQVAEQDRASLLMALEDVQRHLG